MPDIMVDLETLGQRPGCSILSIGAVAFNPATGEVHETDGYYGVINRKSCELAKLEEDESTINWWSKQSDGAREVLKQASSKKDSLPLTDGLGAFTCWLGEYGTKRQLRIWGNGSDFDNAILAVCYARAGLALPWEFWNNRCYRTLKNLVPNVKLDRTGTYHNALDDAISQARHAIDLFKAMRA